MLKYLEGLTEQDIADAYHFGPFQESSEVFVHEGLVAVLLKAEDFDGFSSWVHVAYVVDIIKHDSGVSILDNLTSERGIARELHPRKRLKGPYCDSKIDRLGKVAVNVAFALQLSYRNKGIGSVVYQLEEKLYRKWGAEEIHLYAMYDGRVVWRKRGFVLDCVQAGHIDYLYSTWCKENSIAYAPVNDFGEYPDSFLLSGLVAGIEMYKELKRV